MATLPPSTNPFDPVLEIEHGIIDGKACAHAYYVAISEKSYKGHVLHSKNVDRLREASPMRDKRERFVELGEARVKKAAQMIRLIGNLSNHNNYEYSDEDAQKIISALDAELKLLRAKFQAGLSKRATGEFRLK